MILRATNKVQPEEASHHQYKLDMRTFLKWDCFIYYYKYQIVQISYLVILSTPEFIHPKSILAINLVVTIDILYKSTLQSFTLIF